MPRPLRLIDLHCDWLLQYAAESTVFDPSLYSGVGPRLSQAEGYLTGTSAAVMACYRRSEDWSRQADPWQTLGELLARVEAEFPGRILTGPADFERWCDDDNGLCWAILGVEGFDALVRTAADLDRLPALFERGVRVFQPVYSADNVLSGSSAPGDGRGLTGLGREFLGTLADVASLATGPRPLLDLAHMNPPTMSDALAWFEEDPTRADRLIPVYSHGAVWHEGFTGPRAITLDNVRRLRELGGVIGFSVGPPFHTSAEDLKKDIETAAAFPFRGQAGFEGIAIGTDFLGVDQTLAGLGNAEEVVAWITHAFDGTRARAILNGTARALIARLTGGV